MVDIYVDIDEEYKTIDISGFVGNQHVITLNARDGKKWTMAMSSCLPSDIDKARLYVECYEKAFKAMDEQGG